VGPWVYKRNGLYYLVFAAECCSEFIGYSTAPGPTGPWTYRGTIMPRQGGSFTNHPGVIDFNGNSYFFYHNGALPGGGGYTRSLTDGTVDNFDSNGYETSSVDRNGLRRGFRVQSLFRRGRLVICLVFASRPPLEKFFRFAHRLPSSRIRAPRASACGSALSR